MAARVLSFVRCPYNDYGDSIEPSRNVMSERSLAIHARAMASAKAFRKAEIEIIEVLREVEDDRTYRHFNQTSIYEYAMKTMKLSENVALTMIAIMRKSRSVPELKEAIRNGSVTTSKAKKIISVINEENKAAWLELAATQTSKQIEKAVVSIHPMSATKESLRYKTTDRLELVLGVSENWSQMLTRVKDVASQKLKRAVSTEEALQLAMARYLESFDPLEKASRAHARESNVSNGSPASEKPSQSVESATVPKDSPFSRTVKSARKPLAAALKHAVVMRDQNQCTERDENGHRCENRRWLDVHHIVPVAESGFDELDNLRMLCSEHHKMRHG
jgi:hypothetical protein